MLAVGGPGVCLCVDAATKIASIQLGPGWESGSQGSQAQVPVVTLLGGMAFADIEAARKPTAA